MRPEDVFFRNQDDVYLPLMTPDGSCNLVTNGYLMQKLGGWPSRSSSKWRRPHPT